MPKTLIEVFRTTVAEFGDSPAYSYREQKKWVTRSYKYYYEQVKFFAKACISLNLTEQRSVNILGFNSFHWAVAFYGSMFGNYLPVGIYTTNNADACQYVAENSDCELAVVENAIQLDKFL